MSLSPSPRRRRRGRGRLLAGTAPLPLIPLREWVWASLMLSAVSRLLASWLSERGRQRWSYEHQADPLQGLPQVGLASGVAGEPEELADPADATLLSVLQQLDIVLCLLEQRSREALRQHSCWLLLEEDEIREVRWLLGLIEHLLRRLVRERDLPLPAPALARLREAPPLLRRLGRALRWQPRRESLN